MTIPKIIYSRDGQWAYTMCGESWVADATHLPSCRTFPMRASLAKTRKLAATGALLTMLNEPSR